MTPQCPSIQDDLKALLDSELSLPRRWAVRRHLAGCAACREEMKIMEQIGQQLEAHEATQPQPALNPALREKILTAIPDEPAVASPAPQPSVKRTSYGNFIFQSGIVVTSVLVFIAATTMFGGRKISNTFQASSNAMTGGDSWDYGSGHPATSSASPARVERSKMAKVRDDVSSILDSNSKAPDQLTTKSIPSSTEDAEASTAPSLQRKVHQEARITVDVDGLEEKSNTVMGLVKSYGGFIANNTLATGANGRQAATLTLRVPVQRFENLLADVGKLGDVKAKNVVGEDVTEQFSDARQADIVLGSELGVKESILKEALLKAEKAEKAGEPFATNWQLRTEVRRLRIEAAQVRARYELLQKLANLANVDVELREKPRVAVKGGFLQQMGGTSQAALESSMWAVRIPIAMTIWIIAFLPIWLPLVLIYRIASKHYQKSATHV